MRLLPTSLSLALTAALSLPAAAQDWAIEFNNGAVSFPHDAVMNTTDEFTAEAWVRAPASSNGSGWLFDRLDGSLENKSLRIASDGTIEFVYADSPTSVQSTAPGTFPFDNAFHHVAAVRHLDGTYQVFLDGTEVLNAGPGPCGGTCNILNSTPDTIIGRDTLQTQTPNGWQITELRVSSIDRYSTNFVPASKWSDDASTILMCFFDEGIGTTTADVSSNAQIGTLVDGAEWKPATDNFEIFDLDPQLPDEINDFTVFGGTPGANIEMRWSARIGTKQVQGCPGLHWGIRVPRVVANEIADANGVVRFWRYVPQKANGRTIYLQAVDHGICIKTGIKAIVFP